MDEDEEDPETNAANQMKPFSFNIDEEVGTDVLTNDQVYDDLRELEDILEEGQSQRMQMNLKIGKSKRKK
jgi:hypothetical protein